MKNNIKLFRNSNLNDLELQINKFLHALPSEKELIDIKLSTSGNWVTALVHYKN